jgi:hypothetical protein
MARIGASLGAHHDYLERLLDAVVMAARAADWPAYRAGFATLQAAVLEHMAYEDEELFPELARALGSDTDIVPLEEEHDELRRGFETLGAAAPEHDPEGCLAEMEELGKLLREHHEHEVRWCYAQSDRLLAPDVDLAHSAQIMNARAARSGSSALDLRGLQPPEPITRIFAALQRNPGTPLRVVLPHEPVPLYGLLLERGFTYTGTARSDGGFEVLIERS